MQAIPTPRTRSAWRKAIAIGACAVMLAGCETSDSAAARIGAYSPDEMRAVSDQQLCSSFAWDMRRNNRRQPNMQREITRRRLDCSEQVARTVPDCTGMRLVRHFPNPTYGNVHMFVVTNTTSRRKRFRTYYRSIVSSEFVLDAGQTNEFGVATQQAMGALAAAASAQRGRAAEAASLTDCYTAS